MLSHELLFLSQNYAPVLASCGVKTQRANILNHLRDKFLDLTRILCPPLQ